MLRALSELCNNINHISLDVWFFHSIKLMLAATLLFEICSQKKIKSLHKKSSWFNSSKCKSHQEKIFSPKKLWFWLDFLRMIWSYTRYNPILNMILSSLDLSELHKRVFHSLQRGTKITVNMLVLNKNSCVDQQNQLHHYYFLDKILHHRMRRHS